MENRIREWRERRRLTQEQLALRAGTTKMQISRLERAQRRLTQGWMQRLGEALGCHPAELLPLPYPAAEDRRPSPREESAGPMRTPAFEETVRPLSLREEVRPAEDHPLLAAGALPRDIAVLGTSRGGVPGDESDFQMNGTVVDYIRRPPGIAKLRDVFALYVVGESMSPWREPGDIIYVSSARQPRPGDYVVVELQPEREGDPQEALLKRLIARRGDHLLLEQYNPRTTLEIELARVRTLHRVIDWAELLGV